MPEKIVLPNRDPTDADLAWFADLAARAGACDDAPLEEWVEALTQSERDRFFQCAVYYASQSVDPETQTLLEDAQEAARKTLGEMQAPFYLPLRPNSTSIASSIASPAGWGVKSVAMSCPIACLDASLPAVAEAVHGCALRAAPLLRLMNSLGPSIGPQPVPQNSLPAVASIPNRGAPSCRRRPTQGKTRSGHGRVQNDVPPIQIWEEA